MADLSGLFFNFANMEKTLRNLITFAFLLLGIAGQAQPKVVAHRGYWDVEGSAQNSITALEKAAEINCYGSEFDVIITRDGIPVIHHDDSIRGLRIEEHNYDELKDHVLANGEKLPTLKNYLKRGRQLLPMQLILEIKPHLTAETENRAVDAVVELVSRYGLQNRTEFISFSMNICERLHAQLPDCKVAYLNGDLSPSQVMEKGLTGIDYHFSIFTDKHPEWLEEASQIGCEVNVWTVNSREMLEMFAADHRVDIITTNAPVLLQEIITNRPASMASRMDSVLSVSPFMKLSNMGVIVYDATANTMLYQREPNKLHRPASTQKLFTCMAALKELGLDYTLNTQVKYTGQVVQDRQKKKILEGDFYVIGGMNPAFTKKDLKEMVEQCSTLGIDSIAGKIYADLSMKNRVGAGQGWCWDDTGDDFPKLNPLLVDRDSTFIPQFVELLKEKGIGVQGTDYAVCPEDAQMLAFNSTTLRSLIPLCLKTSDNLFAESILYQLGKKDGVPFAETKVSLEYVRKLLQEVCPDNDGCSIVDGSGLSFYNMMTPNALFGLLKYIYKSEYFSEIRGALPIAGQDGTLQKRFKKTPAEQRLFAKTGSISGTSALAGYALSSNSHMLIFVMMNDGVPRGQSAQARELQDQLCMIMCE